MKTGTMLVDANGSGLDLFEGDLVNVEEWKFPTETPRYRVSLVGGGWEDHEYLLVDKSYVRGLSTAERFSEAVEEAFPHRLDGDTGMTNMNELAKRLGYTGHAYRYGSPLEAFLGDNSGAMEAILEWIAANPCEEWADNLES